MYLLLAIAYTLMFLFMRNCKMHYRGRAELEPENYYLWRRYGNSLVGSWVALACLAIVLLMAVSR